MSRENSGWLVKTKSGKLGRTIHSKGVINGKIPVYLAEEMVKDKTGYEYPKSFSKNAILCEPDTLLKIGFID